LGGRGPCIPHNHWLFSPKYALLVYNGDRNILGHWLLTMLRYNWDNPKGKQPKELPHVETLRREQDTSVLERKPKESLNGEPLGAGLQQYIYYTTRVLCEAIHEAVCCTRQWTQLPSCGKAMLMTSRDTACTARGCGPDRSTDKRH